MAGTEMSANTRNIIKLILGTFGCFAVLLAVQAILTNHNRRLDLTPEKKFTLSPRTEKIVSNLKKDVQAIAFINSDRPENFFVEDMLWRMSQLSNHFHYNIVDMNRNPALARQYNAVQYGTLVFESNGKRKDALVSSGESMVALTLLQVTRDKEITIYFLTGHGEHSLNDDVPRSGYSKLRGAIADESYEEKTLSLATTGTVPDDADVVVILGPQSQFLSTDLTALDAYVQRGGSLFVLLDVNGSSSLIPLLEKYNIHLPERVAVDPAKRLYAGEIITYRVSATAQPHPMLLSVNAPPIFSLARIVEVREDAAKGIIARPILATSGEGFGTELSNISKEGTAEFVAGRDISGPVPIAGEIALKTGDTFGRIAVFGDADMLNNSLLDQGGNRDLFVNAINSLAEDYDILGERPARETQGMTTFVLTEKEGQWILMMSTVVLPGLFFLTGIAVFFWRRQRG
ncbi:MAG: GldG family protein [Candidatus Binatia bacterium]